MISGRLPRIASRTRSWCRWTSRRERRLTSQGRSTSSNRAWKDAPIRLPLADYLKPLIWIARSRILNLLSTEQLPSVFQKLSRALLAVAVLLRNRRVGESRDDRVDLVL